MSSTRHEVTGYTVTLEVFVPSALAERAVDRLDASWHVENWTPKAAAAEVARDALRAAGMENSASLGIREVLR